MKEAKAKKLVQVARMYYIEGLNQSDIADNMGISRPMVSRLLSEAKEFGVVNITINDPDHINTSLANRIKTKYNLKDIVLVSKDRFDKVSIMDGVSRTAMTYYTTHFNSLRNVGIGWGSTIGSFLGQFQYSLGRSSSIQNVCPLVGNSSISNRNYHSSELVRIFSEKTGANPLYLHSPAFVESSEEISMIRNFENYRQVEGLWKSLNLAVFSVGNYPSVPDFATAFRYGSILTTEKAVGRVLSYFFDADGNLITSPNDFAVQIPIEYLKACPVRMGICSPSISPTAVRAVLKAGLITHLIISEELGSKLL